MTRFFVLQVLICAVLCSFVLSSSDLGSAVGGSEEIIRGADGSLHEDATLLKYSFFSVGAGSLYIDLMYPAAMKTPGLNVAAHSSKINAMGIYGIRIILDWSWVEAVSGKFNFSTTDKLFYVSSLYQLHAEPVFVGNPVWQGYPKDGKLRLPKDPLRFAAFVKQSALRYGRGGSFWKQYPKLPYYPIVQYEIWNEPNLPQFAFGATAAAYGKLLVASAMAAKSADPNATVILAGLSPHRGSGPQYLKNIINSNPAIKKLITGVGYHPYGSSGADSLKKVAAFRTAMNSVGLNSVGLRLNEFGLLGNGTRAQQATYTQQFLTLAIQNRKKYGIAKLAPYQWWARPIVSKGKVIQDESRWGILANLNATLTAEGQAYANAIKTFKP
jgi:hypothetical protein